MWLALAGCRHTTHETAVICPAGATLKGAAPPNGRELWCEKIVDGAPVKDGPFIVYADGGGKLIEGTYRDGVQEGEWTTWYENGQRSAVDYFHRGLQDGPHLSWYANGQKAIEGNYRAGKREGVWTRWDPSGLTSRRERYAADKVER
ncbi:MAG TPA: hypothetical protein VKS22_07345 [Candidatus Binataceae bacterium]|nr:hypothetical protein [Candidatus Binataceae bacterium]